MRDGTRRGARFLTAGSRRRFDSVFRSLWQRKIYHLATGTVLVAVIATLPQAWLLGLGVSWLVLFGMVSRRLSTAVLGLLVVNLVSGSRLVTLGTAAAFVAGDGMSALVGTIWPVGRWSWNPRKTMSGSVAFAVFGALALAVVVGMVASPDVGRLAVLSVLPAVAGAAAEMSPWGSVPDLRDGAPDDNLAVTLVTGGVLGLLLAVLGITG
jgi:hypothetical protein